MPERRIIFRRGKAQQPICMFCMNRGGLKVHSTGGIAHKGTMVWEYSGVCHSKCARIVYDNKQAELKKYGKILTSKYKPKEPK